MPAPFICLLSGAPRLRIVHPRAPRLAASRCCFISPHLVPIRAWPPLYASPAPRARLPFSPARPYPRFPSPQTGVVRPALSPPIAPISFIRAPASPPRRCPSCPPLHPLSRHSSPSYPPAAGIRRRGSSSPSPTPNAPPPYRPQASAHPPPRRPNLPPPAPRRQALYIHTPPYGVSTRRIQVALAETKHAAMERKKVQPRAHKGPERRTPGVKMKGKKVRPRAHKGPERRTAGVNMEKRKPFFSHSFPRCGASICVVRQPVLFYVAALPFASSDTSAAPYFSVVSSSSTSIPNLSVSSSSSVSSPSDSSSSSASGDIGGA